jgi:hypothetical protein
VFDQRLPALIQDKAAHLLHCCTNRENTGFDLGVQARRDAQ